MKTLLVSLAIIAVATADVSHLTNRYLPPNHQHQPHPQQQQQRNYMPSNERVETTIEKHEVIELPTQIEIIKDGQPIYGVHSMSNIEYARMSANTQPMPEIRSRYLPPPQDIENLQPPQTREQQMVPYEMPMRSYLPPVAPETTTTEMPTTTTEMATASTTPMTNEETTEQMSTQPMTTTTEQEGFETTTTSTTEPTMPRNRYLPPVAEPGTHYLPPTATVMPEQQYLAPAMPHSQYLPPAMPEKYYLPPVAMPENHYMAPMDMMMPPPPPMPQPTYQEYQEQLLREQQMQQMYREDQMNEMMDAISQMEQRKMIALDDDQPTQTQQMQPVAPVEPAHTLRDDGYHYKTADDDLRRFRYRH